MKTLLAIERFRSDGTISELDRSGCGYQLLPGGFRAS
jgi:hypothetical protein